MTGSSLPAPPPLDWVSPLPPVRTGIADYSRDLLPHLAAVADVRVIGLPGQPVDEALARRFPPAPAADTGAGGRLPVYQMGNNRHHRAVAELARARPGVMTLHDLVLHHLLAEVTLGEHDWPAYAAALERDHGWIGAAAARPRRWGGASDAALFALAAHRDLLRGQRGVLVHSRWAAARIAEDDPEIAVRVVPMAMPLVDSASAADREAGRDFRRRRGIPEDRPLLASVGFQTRIKRTGTALAALARPELDGVHLLVVGEVSPELDYAAEAARLGVAERLTVTGFVGFDELEAAIAASDLCLNLRYPTAGETSASLLRILAAGRPAVVSDHGQFAELPAEAALRVPLGEPDEEAAALAETVAELLAAPGRLAAMGEAARRYVAREHDPATAAAALVAACAELAGREPPGPAAARPAPPTTLIDPRLAGELTVEGAEPPWPAGERRSLRIRLTNRGPQRWLAARRGDGGVALALALARPGGGDPLAGRPWLRLPADLPPGGETVVEAAVRRPPGPARLSVEIRVVGVAGFDPAAAPRWEGAL